MTPDSVCKWNEKIPILVSNPSSEPLELSRKLLLGHVSGFTQSQTRNISAMVANETTKRIIHRNQVDLTKIPPQYREKYFTLLQEFSDVFSVNPEDVGRCSIIKHDIRLKNPNNIINIPPYRVPHNLKEVVFKYVDRLLTAGVIRKSKSPFSSPLMLVKKAGAGIGNKTDLVHQYRVVHDFRRLNQAIIHDSHPLQNLNELIDNVAQGKVWSLIDLSSGFWNQELTPSSKQYTAFGVPELGNFEYNRSPQGLCTSPGNFQRLMNYVIQGLKNVWVYIDDVIISTSSHEAHIATLRDLLSRFRKYGLKCRVEKMQLGAAEVNFLGYNITHSGIRAGLAKVIAIKQWKQLTSQKEIKQFLGLCSFFRRTIPHFARIALPLTRLTRKDTEWQGGQLPPAAQIAFTTLKEKLCSRPCLAPVDYSKEFMLYVDGSGQGYGAILAQRDMQGDIHACAYASRSLKEEEGRQPSFVLEQKAVLWACKNFKPYLQGRHFTIFSDHHPNSVLNRTHGNVISRVQSELQEFQPFTVKYLPGPQMPADFLSRPPRQLNSMDLTSEINVTWEQILRLQTEDQNCKSLACYLKFKQIPAMKSYRSLVLQLKDSSKLINGVVCVVTKQGGWVPFVPFTLRQVLLHLAHDNPLAGHRGVQGTLRRLQTKWWWPKMVSDVDRYCRQCRACNEVNFAPQKPVPLEPMKLAGQFGDRVNVDLLGPLPRSVQEDYCYLMVMTDAFSRFMELIPLRTKQAEAVAQGILEGWICKHGCFRTLGSDLGSENNNKIMKELRDKLQFNHIFSSVAHPASNGICERKNRDILAYLRKYLEGKSNTWAYHLPALMFAYNTAVHKATSFTPFYLAYNRRPILPSDHFGPVVGSDRSITQCLNNLRRARIDAKKNLADSFEAQKRQFDKRAAEKSVQVGDKVYMRRSHTGDQFQKFQKIYKGPFTVIKLLIHNNVMLWDETTDKQFKTHVNHIKMVKFENQSWDNVVPEDKEIAPIFTDPTKEAHKKFVRFQTEKEHPQWFYGGRKFVVYEDDERRHPAPGGGGVVTPPHSPPHSPPISHHSSDDLPSLEGSGQSFSFDEGEVDDLLMDESDHSDPGPAHRPPPLSSPFAPGYVRQRRSSDSDVSPVKTAHSPPPSGTPYKSVRSRRANLTLEDDGVAVLPTLSKFVRQGFVGGPVRQVRLMPDQKHEQTSEQTHQPMGPTSSASGSGRTEHPGGAATGSTSAHSRGGTVRTRSQTRTPSNPFSTLFRK
jgi:hypothetical protein